MAFLSGLLGGTRRRRGMGGYGYGAPRAYGRAPASSGFLASPLTRMALGGLAAYGARRFYASRRAGQASVQSGSTSQGVTSTQPTPSGWASPTPGL